MTSQKTLVAISSTFDDLPAHRQAALDACARVGVQPLMVESLNASDRPLYDVAEEIIQQADIYLGIFGFHYGNVPDGYNMSLLELEYLRAGARGIPRLLFFMSDDHPIKIHEVDIGDAAERLSRLKDKITRTHVVSYFSSPEDLRAKIIERLVTYQSHQSEQKRALLLIPYAPKYERVWATVAAALDQEGLTLSRVDSVMPGVQWANAIADAIKASALIVADVTGANSNVIYELGYAHALKKPTILVIESDGLSALPSDLQSYQILVYDPDDLVELHRLLSRLLRAYFASAAA